MTLLINSTFEHNPTVDIKKTSVQSKFRFTFFAPDSKHMASLQEQMGNSQALKELCGEYDTNLSKVWMSILHNTELFSNGTFLVYVAKVCAYFEMSIPNWHNYWGQPSNPSIYWAYQALRMAITSKEAWFYFKMNIAAGSHRIFCWITQTQVGVVAYTPCPPTYKSAPHLDGALQQDPTRQIHSIWRTSWRIHDKNQQDPWKHRFYSYLPPSIILQDKMDKTRQRQPSQWKSHSQTKLVETHNNYPKQTMLPTEQHTPAKENLRVTKWAP